MTFILQLKTKAFLGVRSCHRQTPILLLQRWGIRKYFNGEWIDMPENFGGKWVPISRLEFLLLTGYHFESALSSLEVCNVKQA